MSTLGAEYHQAHLANVPVLVIYCLGKYYSKLSSLKQFIISQFLWDRSLDTVQLGPLHQDFSGLKSRCQPKLRLHLNPKLGKSASKLTGC